VKRFLLLPLLLLALFSAMLATACSSDEAASPPLELQQQDRDQINRMVTDYLAALDASDMTKALAQLPAGVPNATVTKAIDTFHSEGYQLLGVGDMTVSGQDVVVGLTLKDKSGKEVSRTLEFRIDKGEWRLWSPQLKIPA